MYMYFPRCLSGTYSDWVTTVSTVNGSFISNSYPTSFKMQKISTLVSTTWVAKQIQSKTKNVCVVDASWRPKSNTLNEYQQKHIPGALFFDIGKCSAPGGEHNLSFTLPGPDAFAKYVGNLGIDNETHVVVYENNAKFGVYSAARVWWMFRVFGHSNVSVMDGGLPLWAKEGNETTDVIPEVGPVKFEAGFLPNLYKSFSDIEANLEAGSFQVMDARPEGMFNGTMPYPRADVEPGHMPNAISIPFTTMIHEQDGMMQLKPPDLLKEAFASTSLDMSKPIAAMCGSGVSSCILVLGAFLTGKEDVALFDGSWEEYYLMMKDKPENILKG